MLSTKHNITIRNLLYGSFLLLGIAVGVCSAATRAAGGQEGAASSGGTTKTITLPRRERNLDFLDSATLAYYLGLDPTTGERLKDSQSPAPSSETHNVAVMFYAQWDRNSHALAPAWDAIGTKLKAGTRRSNLIMGLFDCELDQIHLTICHAAGVTHYPTLMFISPSRTFPHRPHVQKSKKALPHTTQFPGIWQYDKSVLDWLRTMQGMTGWTNFWNKRSNSAATGTGGWWQAASYDPTKADALPVGIPSSGTGDGGGGGVSSIEIQQQAADLKKAQAEKEQYEELSLRGAIMLDAILFPLSNPSNPSSTDVYSALAEPSPLTGVAGWNSTDAKSKVLKTCAMEIALDYCVRLTTQKTNELVAAKKQAQQTEEQPQQTLAELEAELKQMIATAEPYCDIVEQCVVEGFGSETCRPITCPFQQQSACYYLSSCFDETMQKDYAKHLGVELPKPGEEIPTKKKRGWF